jgi:hypothetical protein
MCSNFCNYIYLNLTIINNYVKFKLKTFDTYFTTNNQYKTQTNKKTDSVIIDIPPNNINFKEPNIKITIDDYKEPKPNILPMDDWDMV